MPDIFLDDLAAGQSYDLGRRRVGREEILAFARAYDPQSFHVDEEAARDSIYGGLIASGWHTASMFMRLLVDGFLGRAAALGSPGVDELRWLKPVRPGDELAGRLEILEVRPSQTRPDRGLARCRSEVVNQHGETVLSFVATIFFGRRGA
jgi:acyl dehydratase